MIVGLAGPHRCGKTTLACAFAKKHKLEFVQTSASQVFEDMGLDPAGHYDFATRLTVQEEILRRFDAQYVAARGKPAITDRTPLDMLAYTLADAVQDAVPTGLQGRFERYAQSCFNVTNKRFSVVVAIQPGIPIVAEAGKAAPNTAYVEHLNAIILGLVCDDRISTAHFKISRHVTDLEDRMAALGVVVGKVKRLAELESREAALH
ncbi:MAG: AAA family ATPase [Betaproteobacteria bacterium]|nr:AAA family ATPase [Betaproteobacteria bacterium]